MSTQEDRTPLPRSFPSFNKKELELLLFHQMTLIEAIRDLLIELKMVSPTEFEFLVKKASVRVMKELASEGMMKTVQVFPELALGRKAIDLEDDEPPAE
jgi:hypothetical protein